MAHQGGGYVRMEPPCQLPSSWTTDMNANCHGIINLKTINCIPLSSFLTNPLQVDVNANSHIIYNVGKIFIGSAVDDGSGALLQVAGEINAASYMVGGVEFAYSSAPGRIDLTNIYSINGQPPGSGGTGSPQTPWFSDINAANNTLYNVLAIGIGTSTPAFSLDTTGDINAAGCYYVGAVQFACSNGSGGIVLSNVTTINGGPVGGTPLNLVGGACIAIDKSIPNTNVISVNVPCTQSPWQNNINGANLNLSNVNNVTVNGCYYIGTTNPVSLCNDGSGNLLINGAPISGGASVVVGDTPPASPSGGDLWFDSTDTQLYIWYEDPTSSQWVATINQCGLIGDAPIDGNIYGRQNGSWTQIISGGVTPPAPPNISVQWNNNGVFGGSANFVYDNTNVRVGIGTSTPTYLVTGVAQDPVLALVSNTDNGDGTFSNIFIGAISNGTTDPNLTPYADGAVISTQQGIDLVVGSSNAVFVVPNNAGFYAVPAPPGMPWGYGLTVDQATTNVGIRNVLPKSPLQVCGQHNPVSLVGTPGIITVSTDSEYGTGLGDLSIGRDETYSAHGGIWMQSHDGTGAGTAIPLAINPLGGNIGVGTTAPRGSLEVAYNTVSNAYRGIVNAQYYDGPHSPVLWMIKGRGTLAAPAPAQFGDYLANIIMDGVTTGGSLIDAAQIIAFCTGVGTNTIAGDLAFATNAGTSTPGYSVERMRITGAGNVGIGTSNPGFLVDIVSASSVPLRVTGSSGIAGINNTQLRFAGGIGGDLWALGIDIPAANGSRDFFVYSLGQGPIMTFQQSTGHVGINNVNPQYWLDVSGPINASAYYLNGAPHLLLTPAEYAAFQAIRTRLGV